MNMEHKIDTNPYGTLAPPDLTIDGIDNLTDDEHGTAAYVITTLANACSADSLKEGFDEIIGLTLVIEEIQSDALKIALRKNYDRARGFLKKHFSSANAAKSVDLLSDQDAKRDAMDQMIIGFITRKLDIIEQMTDDATQDIAIEALAYAYLILEHTADKSLLIETAAKKLSFSVPDIEKIKRVFNLCGSAFCFSLNPSLNGEDEDIVSNALGSARIHAKELSGKPKLQKFVEQWIEQIPDLVKIILDLIKQNALRSELNSEWFVEENEGLPEPSALLYTESQRNETEKRVERFLKILIAGVCAAVVGLVGISKLVQNNGAEEESNESVPAETGAEKKPVIDAENQQIGIFVPEIILPANIQKIIAPENTEVKIEVMSDKNVVNANPVAKPVVALEDKKPKEQPANATDADILTKWSFNLQNTPLETYPVIGNTMITAVQDNQDYLWPDVALADNPDYEQVGNDVIRTDGDEVVIYRQSRSWGDKPGLVAVKLPRLSKNGDVLVADVYRLE